MTTQLRRLCAAVALCLAPAAAFAQHADPALWVVKDRDTTIYLFGTMHALKPGVTWFDGRVKSAFDASSEVIFETIEPPADELRALVMRLAVSTDGKSLTEKLSEPRQADLARVLSSYGMPANALDRFEPWFASVMLDGLALPKAGFDPASGADHALTEAARKQGKTLVGLETAEEQFALFEAAPEPMQITYLGTVLDEVDRVPVIAAQTAAQWSAGDADGLGQTINAEMAKTPTLAKRMIADRNARWADWVATRMRQPGTVFFAVGAGHLGSPANMRELLAAKGLKVERVK